VHAKDFLVDQRSNGQAVEAVGENFPQFNGVSPLALIVKSVDPVDGRALVIASKQEEIFRVLDLVGKQQAYGLQGLFSAVNVVAQEEVVRIGWEAAILEKAKKIIILAVNIA
jgi:hypothetical protein